MEFTASQLSLINLLLPTKYKIEFSGKPSVHVSKPSKAKPALTSPPVHLPEKRVAEKPIDLIPMKLSENSSKLLKIITDLKKHEKYPIFEAHCQQNHQNSINIPKIESRIYKGEYKNSYEFGLDVRKVWGTSFALSAGKQEIYLATVELSVLFEGLFAAVGNLQIEEIKKQVEASPVSLPKNQKIIKNEIIKKGIDRPLNCVERAALCQNIKKLESKYFKGVLDIVRDSMEMVGQELEIDIEKMPPKTARELERYVKQCLSKSFRGVPKNTVEEIKISQQETYNKLAQLEKASNQNAMKQATCLPNDSESESSSTSESESEEMVQSTLLTSC